jgi:hypothetical protein
MMRYRSLHLSLLLISFISVPACFSGKLPDQIDLNVTPGTESADVVRVYGETSFDLIGGGGQSVAMGDLDGDGLSDLLIGSKEVTPFEGVTSAGAVYVLFGEKDLERQTVNLLTGEGSLDVTPVFGTDPMAKVGFSVAAGDVNGDGIDDAVIGAAGVNLEGATEAGGVIILYGDSAIRDATDGLTPAASSTVILGATAWERIGWSVAVGDINSDGYTDVITGGLPEASGIFSGGGKAYVVFGGPDLQGEVIQLNESAAGEGQTLILDQGGEVPNRLGYSAASGDVDGDGYDDVILGAPHGDGISEGSYYAGGAFVVYGGPSLAGTVVDLSQESGDATQIFGDDEGDNAGYSVASGDVSGDGFFEVILGAPYENYVSSDYKIGTVDSVGAVYAVYGGPDIRGMTVDLASDDSAPIPGATHIIGRYGSVSSGWRGAMTGWSIASGDVNGDGLDDILTGGVSATVRAPVTGFVYIYDIGIANLIYGASDRVGKVIQLQTETVGVEVLGDNQGDTLGHAVASAGDMNGDGFAEFAASAPQAENPVIPTPAQNEAGMVALIKGDGISAKARRVRRTGNADPPPLRFGTAARCLIDYATAGEINQTTVTIQRSAPENPPEGAESVLPVQWSFDTSLDQFEASATFRYTDAELGGTDESRLEVFTSPDGSVGSWQRAGTNQILNSGHNEIRVEGLSHFSHFSIVVLAEPAPTETPTITQTPKPSPTPTITETLEPTPTPTETLEPSVTPTLTPTPDPTQVLLDRADLNDNGRIDVFDLLIFESLWLREVPE